MQKSILQGLLFKKGFVEKGIIGIWFNFFFSIFA